MQKRPLASAVIFFFAGIFISAYDIKIYPFIIVSFLAVLFSFYSGRKSAIYIAFSIMLFSGFAAAEFADYKRTEIQSAFSGLTEEMTVTVTDFSDNNGVSVVFNHGKSRIRAFLKVSDNIALYPGDIITGEFTFKKPYKAVTQLSGFAQQLSGKGIFLLASAEKVHLAGFKTDGITGKIYYLRRFLDAIGEKNFSGNARALFNAMIFGDKRLVSDRLYLLLQASGLNHIAVVSGLHLSVIISFLTFFIHKLFGKSRFSVIPSFLGALFFTLLSGAGAGVTRAFIMCFVFLASRLLYRDSDSLTSLSVAAFVMAVLNPFIIFNAGFVLSVLSVLGILLYSEKLGSFFSRFMPELAASLISLSISAQLAVLPALVHYFGFTAPYAIISNLLVISLASLYVVTGMLLTLFHKAGIIAEAFRILLSFISDAIEAVCDALGRLPGAFAYINPEDSSFTLLWLIVLALLCMYPLNRKKMMHSAALLGLTAVIFIASGKHDTATSFFPAGKQTLTVMQEGSRIPFIVDCPDSYDVSLMGNPPECIVLSSQNEGDVFSEYTDTKRIIVPEEILGYNEKERLAAKAAAKGIKIQFAGDNESFRLGSAILRYLPLKDIRARAIEIKKDGKTLITLQGADPRDIRTLLKNNTVFNCDYLLLPSGALPEDLSADRLCTGEIIPNNKFVLQW